MTTRTTFEAALADLLELASRPDEPEASFQSWFERHRIAFEVYGFTEVLAHPSLETSSGEEFIPDFLVRRTDGLWEVFELKRLDTPILTKARRRRTFTAEFAKYVRQCREYAHYFRDDAHRARFESRYGVRIEQADLDSTIVAGLNEDVDRALVYSLLVEHGAGRVRHATFDDVAALIDRERTRHYGATEDLRGVGIYIVATLFPLTIAGGRPPRTMLFDIGTDADRNRVTVFVDAKDRLCLEARDDTGEIHPVRVAAGAGWSFGQRTQFAFELGLGDSFAVQTVEADGRVLAENRTDPFALELSEHHVMGSDLHGEGWSAMDLEEVIVFNRTLPFETKFQARAHLARRMSRPGNSIRYFGHTFMHSNGHPNFPEGRHDTLELRPPRR